MDNPLISVIVPVYNVEKYISMCLDSIVEQSYRNLEIILVDDGTPDASGKICEQYAAKDSRITVIHKENGGLSSARNAGMKVAHGSWILFVDSDDAVSRDACSMLLEAALKTDSDLAIAESTKFIDTIPTESKLKRSWKVFSAEETLIMYFYRKIPGYAWGKLYKREIAKKHMFPEGKLFEDVFTVPKYINDAKRIVILDQSLFYYRQVASSIVNSGFIHQKMDLLDANNELLREFGNRNKEMRKAIVSKQFVSCADLLGRLYKTKGSGVADKKALIRGINDSKWTVLRDSHNTAFVRAMALTAVFSPALMGYISSKRTISLKRRV